MEPCHKWINHYLKTRHLSTCIMHHACYNRLTTADPVKLADLFLVSLVSASISISYDLPGIAPALYSRPCAITILLCDLLLADVRQGISLKGIPYWILHLGAMQSAWA